MSAAVTMIRHSGSAGRHCAASLWCRFEGGSDVTVAELLGRNWHLLYWYREHQHQRENAGQARAGE